MIADLKPYPAMKDSGVPWLGKVPEHWKVGTLRRKLRSYDGIKIGPFGSQLKLEHLSSSGYKVYGQANVIARDFSRGTKFVDQKKFDELSACELRAGDLVVTMMGTGGRCACLPCTAAKGIMDSHLLRLRMDDSIDVSFAALVMDESPYVRDQISVVGKGSIMQGLNSVMIKNLSLALPPLPEQVGITRFLVYVDRRIRKYIRAKQKLIQLLEKQKQAIIHRAVTRGLDPNVRLKPSGVDWLGDVPEHWEVRRLKTLISNVTSGSRGWSNYAADDGPLFIRIGNLTRSSIDLDLTNSVRLNLPIDALSEAERTRVRAGDLLLSITAYIGSVAVVPEGIGEAYISQHVACCRPISERINIKWLAYVLLSSVGQTHGKLCMYGGTKQGLSLDDVKNYVCLLPLRADQDLLVSWIERTTKNIDEATSCATREIALLREYRIRLIADVATGKLDVREAAAHLPAEADETDLIDDMEEQPENGADDPVEEVADAE